MSNRTSLGINPFSDFLRSSQTVQLQSQAIHLTAVNLPFFGYISAPVQPFMAAALQKHSHLWTFLTVKWPKLTQYSQGEGGKRGWLPVIANALWCFSNNGPLPSSHDRNHTVHCVLTDELAGCGRYNSIVYKSEGHTVLQPLTTRDDAITDCERLQRVTKWKQTHLLRAITTNEIIAFSKIMI